MQRLRGIALLLSALLALAAAAARTSTPRRATGTIAAAAWPYLPGSVVPLRVDGFVPPYHAALIGPGRFIEGSSYEIPQDAQPGTALLVAGNATGLAARKLRIAGPPSMDRELLLVASYDDGVVFHDARTFSVLGVLGTGGAPTDVAIGARGTIAAADTQGTSLMLATLSPWSVTHVEGVVFGDEVAIDPTTHAVFVTDRDVAGAGALTRITPAGRVTRVATGETAEGIAIDDRRQLVYVANANDGTVAEVGARSMQIVRRFKVVNRIFSLVLSPDGTRLYGISNQSAGSPFAAPGSAVALVVRGARPHIVARSADLEFPLGAALDAARQTLFVSDEGSSEIDVLDARTLRPKSTPLRTCGTPWKPFFDLQSARLYVPCAGSDAIDVFDARTLRRIRDAPFRTGGYPLAVAAWRPSVRILPGKIRTRREGQRAAQ